MGDVIRGPWSAHPFRGQHVVMFRVRSGWGWTWGRLHLEMGDGNARCSTPKPSKIRATWRSRTNNSGGWNPGAYQGSEADFRPCKRCLRLLEQ